MRKNSTDVRELLLAAPKARLPSNEREKQSDTTSLSFPEYMNIVFFAQSSFISHSYHLALLYL